MHNIFHEIKIEKYPLKLVISRNYGKSIVLVLQWQIFINKIHEDKWNHIDKHSLLHHLLFKVSEICYCVCPLRKVLLNFL